MQLRSYPYNGCFKFAYRKEVCMDQWVQRQSDRKRSSDTEHEYLFRIDQSRIINSVAFRRLQSKTQVHGVGESDFF